MIFLEKTKKNLFLDKVYGSMFTIFQVCIVFVWPGGVAQIHTYTSEIGNILDRMLASRGFLLLNIPVSCHIEKVSLI